MAKPDFKREPFSNEFANLLANPEVATRLAGESLKHNYNKLMKSPGAFRGAVPQLWDKASARIKADDARSNWVEPLLARQRAGEFAPKAPDPGTMRMYDPGYAPGYAPSPGKVEFGSRNPSGASYEMESWAPDEDAEEKKRLYGGDVTGSTLNAQRAGQNVLDAKRAAQEFQDYGGDLVPGPEYAVDQWGGREQGFAGGRHQNPARQGEVQGPIRTTGPKGNQYSQGRLDYNRRRLNMTPQEQERERLPYRP